MSSPILGLGLCPIGIVPNGFGSPAIADPLDKNILEDSQGLLHDARLIDVTTRDYVIDSNGVTSGMSAVAQQVYLALVTTLGSSAIATLGSDVLSTRTMGDDFQRKVQRQVASALSALISSQTISLISVSVVPYENQAGASITVVWMDNTSNQLQTTAIT